MDPEAIEDDDTMPEIWDINARALQLFLDLITQWRIASKGGGFAPSRLIFLGLDYSAVDTVMRRKGYADELFEDLQVMEGAALDAFASEGLA